MELSADELLEQTIHPANLKDGVWYLMTQFPEMEYSGPEMGGDAVNSKDITLWIDERWYDALNRHLKDETLEEHLRRPSMRCAASFLGRSMSVSAQRSGKSSRTIRKHEKLPDALRCSMSRRAAV